jgi:ATP-dependent exoDNAse (exonuclease V) alpha subunit
MQINTVSRSSGRNAPASAAYRSGEQIRNERTGTVYDHRNRRDVLHKEMFLPTQLGSTDARLDWARDRTRLWNAAEQIESRADSRVAREYLVALPAELPSAQRVELARAFSREIADRYGVAVDLAVHAPRPFGDPRNHHAHLLSSTRTVTRDGLGAKAGLDMNGTTRAELGLPTNRKEFAALRQRWAELVNEHLRAAHIEARVDARSLQAQGIDREPRPQLPWAAIAAERRGERSEVAERIRARYRARVAARAERAAERSAAPVAMAAQQAPPSEHGAEPSADAQHRQHEAVREWLQYRRARERVPVQPMGSALPESTEEVRRRAVDAWRARQGGDRVRETLQDERASSAASGLESPGGAARSELDPDFSR